MQYLESKFTECDQNSCADEKLVPKGTERVCSYNPIYPYQNVTLRNERGSCPDDFIDQPCDRCEVTKLTIKNIPYKFVTKEELDNIVNFEVKMFDESRYFSYGNKNFKN
jgi:hypothetical protein